MFGYQDKYKTSRHNHSLFSYDPMGVFMGYITFKKEKNVIFDTITWVYTLG